MGEKETVQHTTHNKQEKRNIRKKRMPIWIWILIAAAIIAAIIIIAQSYKRLSDTEAEAPDVITSSADAERTEEPGLQFPYELDGGKLIISSLFQYTGLNPDCGDEEGEDIAALEIVNQSGEFCKTAEIQVIMQNGTELTFKATDIPAGKKVWAFEESNQSIAQDDASESIEGGAVFEEESLMEDQIDFNVDDINITIENLTDTDLTNVSIGCHCLFEDAYFGGHTYSYPIELLPAGETVTVEAVDCYMGSAEVVYITKE